VVGWSRDNEIRARAFSSKEKKKKVSHGSMNDPLVVFYRQTDRTQSDKTLINLNAVIKDLNLS